jgi:hypothetical protein
MKPVVPKTLRGYAFDRLIGVEFNDFDVERLLPSLFYITVTRGRQVARRVNSEKDLTKYVEALSQHGRMRGFTSDASKRLLDRWVRSTVVQMGRLGRSRREEQIEYIQPLTLLTYKSGFPAKISRQRRVHQFLYALFLRALATDDPEKRPEAALGGLFASAFGRGVLIGEAPKYDGQYTGAQVVDIHTLLCLNFLDGLQPCPASNKEGAQADPTLPRIASQLAEDLLSFLAVCHQEMPLLSLTRSLMALINCWLFVYTLKLAYATNDLVARGKLPNAMTQQEATSPPEIYVDLTGERGAASDRLAQTCVEMHLEELRAFYQSIMLLRTLDRFLDALPPQAANAKSLRAQPTPLYFQSLTNLRGNIHVEARASADIQTIRAETAAAAGGPEEVAAVDAEFDRLVASAGPDGALGTLIRLLADAQESNGVRAIIAWFWNTGGLGKPYGLLSGNLRGNRRWRYVMGDDLLAVLVRLSMIEVPEGRVEQATTRNRIALSDFLAFLERRFGFLIDRPPASLDSAATRAAARENLEALKRRLRLMGLFEALSDDFNAQFLRLPDTAEVPA